MNHDEAFWERHWKRIGQDYERSRQRDLDIAQAILEILEESGALSASEITSQLQARGWSLSAIGVKHSIRTLTGRVCQGQGGRFVLARGQSESNDPQVNPQSLAQR